MLLVGGIYLDPQRHAGGDQAGECVRRGLVNQGRVMPGTHIGQFMLGRVEQAVEKGDKKAIRRVGADEAVGVLDAIQGGGRLVNAGAHQAAGEGHEQGGRHALVGNICYNQAGVMDASVRASCQGDEIIEVAADLAGWLPARGKFPAGDLRRLGGQQADLNIAGNLQLAFQAAFFYGCFVEAGIFDGDGGAGGDGVQQFQVCFREAANFVKNLNHADGAFVDGQGCSQQAFGDEAGLGIGGGVKAWVRVGIVDDDALVVFDSPASNALPKWDAKGLDLIRFFADGHLENQLLAFDGHHRGGARLEDALDALERVGKDAFQVK